jgi:hypothetical protein
MVCQVLVPVLIDRKDTWSGVTNILQGSSISAAGSDVMLTSRMTNQPHRECIGEV